MDRAKIDPITRILARADLTGDCWLWTGSVMGSGYGRIGVEVEGGGYVPRSVHRYVYQEMVEPVPDDLVLDHLCEVKRCFNPDHLEIVTRGENTRRGAHLNPTVIRNRAKTHCIHGHPFDAVNTHLDARGARRCRACGRSAQRRRREREAA